MDWSGNNDNDQNKDDKMWMKRWFAKSMEMCWYWIYWQVKQTTNMHSIVSHDVQYKNLVIAYLTWWLLHQQCHWQWSPQANRQTNSNNNSNNLNGCEIFFDFLKPWDGAMIRRWYKWYQYQQGAMHLLMIDRCSISTFNERKLHELWL